MPETIKEKIEFKPKFIERYKNLTDWQTFKDISLTYLRRSIRVSMIFSDEKLCSELVIDKLL